MNGFSSGTEITRRTIGALALGLWVLGLWVLGLGAAEASPTFQRTDNGTAVAAESLGSALSQSGLLATFAPGDRLELYSATIEANADSKVFIALSSEYLAAACLTGQISAGGETAEAGEVILWHTGSQRPEVSDFDVERFLSTTPLAADPVIRAELEALAESQRTEIFWGLLQPERRNARAPVVPTIEEVRRSYLLEPAVVKTRRAAGGDPEMLTRLVAENFLAGLASKDPAPVEALMSPLLFQTDDRAASREAWQELRGRFAKTLVDGGLPDKLAGFQIQDATDKTAVLVRARQATYRLSLVEIDGMLFVQGLERQGGTQSLN